MTNNPLKNFTYSKWHYLTHPWKFIKDCITNIKNAKMRIVRGWSYPDLWNMSDYLLDITIDMLRNLARDSHGYPSLKPFEEPEKWSSWLFYIANELEESKEENYEKKNEYYNEYMEQFKNWTKASKTCSELDKKYFAREKELAEEAKERRTKALMEVVKYFDYLWDSIFICSDCGALFSYN